MGLFRLAQIKDALEQILGQSVDVISKRGVDHTTALNVTAAIRRWLVARL